MTRKHFVAIAAILANTRKTIGGVQAIDAIDSIQDQLADFLATQNGNFDRGRFNRAAEGEE